MWLPQRAAQLLLCVCVAIIALIGCAAGARWERPGRARLASRVAKASNNVTSTANQRASIVLDMPTHSNKTAFVTCDLSDTASTPRKHEVPPRRRFGSGASRSRVDTAAKTRSAIKVESETKSAVVSQYGTTFRPPEVDPDLPPVIDLEQSTPDTLLSDINKLMEDPRSKTTACWRYLHLRTFPQRAALRSLTDLMPASRARECLNVTDGSNVDDLLDPTCHGYYCKRHYKAFFRYEPEFEYMRNGTEVFPRRLEPPKLQLPVDMPTTEGEKGRPSVPLGWRTFAVLGLYHTAMGVNDPAVLWSGFRLTDGDPMGRLASGLYNSPPALRVFTGSDAVMPDNTLLHSKHPIEQGEDFRGRKGDLSHLGPSAPRQHEAISEALYPHRFAADGVWPRKHFECVVSAMTLSQALWARLSATMLRSTAKVHRMYKLRVRKNFKQEVFSARRSNTILGHQKDLTKDPVETSVGVLYFLSAPTLHHAVELACSDPIARCNFYKQLLLFEADDALKYNMFENREPDRDNPRQYLVLGSYDDKDDPELLRDKMMRFVVRSNCVNTHVLLHAPRKDAMVDLSMPLQQFLPITTQQRDRLLGKLDSVRDACNAKNRSPPVADLTVINQFDSDDAIDWARRSPYTRAGCYKSLFVAKAYEIGFYGRHCKYVAPLPMGMSMTPVRQEYAILERDPVDVLRKRMSDGSGHIIALPKVLPRSSGLYQELAGRHSAGIANLDVDESPNHGKKVDPAVLPDAKPALADHGPPSWPKRLLITIRRTVSECFKAANVSAKYTASTRRRVPKQAHLGAVPFMHDGTTAVDVSNPWPADHKSATLSRKARTTTPDDVLHVVGQEGKDEVPGDAQTLPSVTLSTAAIRALLDQNAPVELDTPFYADLLKDYVYVALPAGEFFEFLPEEDNRRFNAMGPDNQTNSQTTAEDLNRLPKNKPIAFSGLWMRKSDYHLLYKSDEERCLLVGRAPDRTDRRRPLSPEMVKRALVRNEMLLDYARKGALLTWPDLSNAYTRRQGQLVSHLTPTEQLKTAWTVPPLSEPHARYTAADELPSARFYEKGVPHPADDPRQRMAQHPREVYRLSLEFLRQVERGEARPEDDPVRALVEADYVVNMQHNDSISTWEEPDVNLINIKPVSQAPPA
ncbi:uncharacterized protein BcabD6B2_01760 [Babesia caballi]|uniref:Transmembrane protein n=1 Tax=Babesia caballi TaxID=5871 RepID=A0AAV4LLS8_BABCB|nr:transmembrane protein [Babesia caballi]